MNVDFLLKFLKFGLVGASGVAVDFSITYLLKEKLHSNKYFANSMGFLVAVTTNYLLNRIWTFQSNSQNILQQYLKFTIIGLVGLGLTNGIIYICHEKLKLNFYFSKLIAIGLVMIWNFGANLLYTFN